jgi:signal transduction histidine kinase
VLTLEQGDLPSAISRAALDAAISTEEIHSIVSSVFEEVEVVVAHLKIQVDRDRDVVAILEKANDALMRISQRVSECVGHEPRALPSMKTLEEDPSLATDVLQAVVHEIRNPLMVVGGFMKKLAQTLSPDSEGSRYVGVILEEASRLERVMEEMSKKLNNI